MGEGRTGQVAFQLQRAAFRGMLGQHPPPCSPADAPRPRSVRSAQLAQHVVRRIRDNDLTADLEEIIQPRRG